MAVVLVTDGDPSDCDTNISTIAGIARSALNYNTTQTYTIGMPGASIADLDQIAAGGGTERAYDATADPALFAVRLEEIRTRTLGCSFPIPEAVLMSPDPLAFSLLLSDGMTSAPLVEVDDLESCAGQSAWYRPAGTDEIELCDVSCATYQASPSSTLSFEFGCPSE